jgi:hypothetical protein
MKRIPKSFEIAGHTFRVKWVSDAHIAKFAGKDSWGATAPAKGIVLLNTRLRKCSADQRAQTFLHEMMHCILWIIREELWSDEALVDALGHAVLQATKSFKY